MSDEAKLRERAHGELGYDCTEHAEGAHNARCDELTSLLRDAAVEATEAALAGMPCSVPDCKNVSWTPGRCRTHLVPALTAEARRDALGEAIEAAERRRQYWRRFLDQGGPDTFKERWDTRESEALCIRDGLRALAAQQPPPSPRADAGVEDLCLPCGGSGRFPDYDDGGGFHDCHPCGGTGKVAAASPPAQPDVAAGETLTCDTCEGELPQLPPCRSRQCPPDCSRCHCRVAAPPSPPGEPPGEAAVVETKCEPCGGTGRYVRPSPSTTFGPALNCGYCGGTGKAATLPGGKP